MIEVKSDQAFRWCLFVVLLVGSTFSSYIDVNDLRSDLLSVLAGCWGVWTVSKAEPPQTMSDIFRSDSLMIS
jgi:hypothetical protein